MARQLEARGEAVERIALIDTPAPLQHTPVDERTMLLWFLEDLNIGFDVSAVNWSDISNNENESTMSLLDRICGYQGIVHDLDLRQLGYVFSVFSKIIDASRQYQPGMVKAHLSVVRARDGKVSEFRDHPAIDAPDWGWSRFTQGNTDCVTSPGSHHTMLSEKNVDSLVAVLKASYC
jgi:thioesterase domain-containing protein